jgi:HAD superfamily hydrolase (TIGR01549 family)
VAGEDFDEESGDEVRERWEKEYDELIDQTRLFEGARELLAALRDRGVTVALASSSIPKHAEHAFDLLDAERLTDTATTAEDAEESKPHPELVDEALSRVGDGVGAGRACLVGDSVWDVEAAARAGVPAYGLLAGGYGRAELEEAGAVAVYDDVADLLAHLDEWCG